jgi:hypothetical protein
MSAELHQERGGELAALINRYFAQVEAFNSFEGDRTDEEANTTAAATYEATLAQMIGVSARSGEDARAAFEFLLKEGR